MATRGLRNVGAGVERITNDVERTAVRRQAVGVVARSVVAAIVTYGVLALLLP
jgi:hypothetical protein